MGRKTFEEIGKLLLVSMISILITSSVTRRTLLDRKLDKSEYILDQAEHKEDHKQDKKDIEYVRGKVDDIYLILLDE